MVPHTGLDDHLQLAAKLFIQRGEPRAVLAHRHNSGSTTLHR
jgi:hypothetical protein